MEAVIGIIAGCGVIVGAFLLAGFTTKTPTVMQPLALPPPPPPPQPIYEPVRLQPVRTDAMKPPVDPNSALVLQGAALQIGSLGKNEAFDIEHTWTESGQKLRFCRVDLPPLVRPMQTEPPRLNLAHETKYEKELKKLRKAAEKVAEGLNGGTVRPTFVNGLSGTLNVDGVPCMLKKSDNGGYDLMLIKPDGKLEFMCHLGVGP